MSSMAITMCSRRTRSICGKSPPFEPRIARRNLFARGSTDNKGQFFAHLKAVEAYLKTGTALPCDLTFVIEGEEEVGSESLASFLKTNKRELDCEAIVISDTGMPSPKHPALGYSLRGIMAFEITLHGPARDLHSGGFGGAVDNPAMALSQLLGRLRDQNGRITITRILRRRETAYRLRTERICPPAHDRCDAAKDDRREKTVW